MKHRKLRIAWSVAWGNVTVLLMVLWVRSYHNADELRVPIRQQQSLRQTSFRGQSICFSIPSAGRWGFTTYAPLNDDWKDYDQTIKSLDWRRTEMTNPGVSAVALPHWFLATISTVFAAAIWLPRSYGLRNLLIATTLVAIFLTLICY